MQCEKCGSDVWDNRQKNEQRVANGQKPFPVFKCRDQSCGWVKWPPKNQGGGAQARSGAGAGNGSAGNGRVVRPLTPLYHKCLEDAKLVVTRVLGKDAAHESIMNAAATLFIAASRDGAPLRPVPKPKPVPVPEPSNDFDEVPEAIYDEDDSLPF